MPHPRLAQNVGGERQYDQFDIQPQRAAPGIERIQMERMPRGAAAEKLRELFGFRKPKAEQGPYAEDLARARAALGDNTFEADWSAGRQMDVEEAVAFALED